VTSTPPAGNEIWGPDWAAARALWSLDPAIAHLNHGSYGAVPIAVRAEQDALREQTEINPMAWFRGLDALLAGARAALAPFVGADPEALSLVPNASAGATIALLSLQDRLRAHTGGEIVITDHAYGAVAVAAERAAAATGLTVHRLGVPLDSGDDQVVAALDAVLGDRTAAVVIDQVTSPTAKLLPVAALVAAAHAHGVPVVVDGAHAPGMLAAPAAGHDADFWVGNLHKWPCAPRGTATMTVAPQWREVAKPLIASWWEDRPYPERFDMQGTLDLTNWITAPRSIALLDGLPARDTGGAGGWDRVRAHNAALATYGQHTICAALDVEPPDVGTPAPSMRLVPLPEVMLDPETAAPVRTALHDEGFEYALSRFAGQAYLRLSAHVYNAPAEYDAIGAVLRKLL
jgi:isopenicillin-N epimerase